MTEAEWLASEDPRPMLAFLRSKVPSRKLRLFVSGCCRQSRWLVSLPGGRGAIEASESWADGLLDQDAVQRLTGAIATEAGDLDYDESLLHFSLALGCGDAYLATFYVMVWLNRCPNPAAERWCANSLRCLNGHLFPHPSVDRGDKPANWLSASVAGLLKLFAGSPLRRTFDLVRRWAR